MRLVLMTLVVLVSWLAPALAVQPDEILPDAKLEARARELSHDLRCMVCQGQSIDDSDAPLARDLRLLVRERLKAGDTNAQVIDYLVARYGEFVLLNPRFEMQTALLWLAPIGMLGLGAITLVLAVRRRRNNPRAAPEAVAPLSPGEQKRLTELTRPGAT
ncbi:MAG TPA: cytochrome c-type biogenesis protein [Xanthobacteraceae bacterium]